MLPINVAGMLFTVSTIIVVTPELRTVWTVAVLALPVPSDALIRFMLGKIIILLFQLAIVVSYPYLTTKREPFTALLCFLLNLLRT